MAAYTLDDYVAWSESSDAVVIVRTGDSGTPDAVAYIVVEPPTATIEMIARAVGSRPGFLAQILLAVEDAARIAGLRELRLEALNEQLVTHYEARGFERMAPVRPIQTAEWGALIPMRKSLL